MKMKSCFITTAIALFAFASCKKNNVETEKPESNSTTATKTIAGTMRDYDYSQSTEQIISDAGGVVSPTSKVLVLPGRYFDINPKFDQWGCAGNKNLCMILVYERTRRSIFVDGGFEVSGGTKDSPIQVVTANATWPGYHRVSEIHGFTSDDGTNTVSATSLD